ncbi:hypothetical protein [Thermomonas fusca]|jgi:hypothetical protein
MKKIARPEPQVTWISPVGEGFQLEISATINGLLHQLVTVVADDQDESLWAQVSSGGTEVQIPLAVLRDALDAAVGQVHSESWYDEQLPTDGEA